VGARATYSAGAGFGALSFVVIAVVTVVSSIATARLYGVAVIGQFALVIAPVNVVWLLSSVGEGPAVVRILAVLEPRAPRCTAMFVAVLVFSSTLTVAVAGLALPVIYAVFNGPIAQPSLFLPAAVTLGGYALVTNPCLNLDLIFSAFRAGRELFWIRLHQAAAFLAFAVALSFAVEGVWGLVVATVGASASALVHRILAVRAFMAFRATRGELREGMRALPQLIRFGLKITPGSLANGAYTELGTWVLAATGPVATLGAYARAWMLASRLLEVNWRVSEMLFPTLVARRSGGDHAGFDRAFVDTLRYCASALLLPAAVGGGAAASIMALYGAGFERAAPALAVLLLVPAAVTLASIQSHVLWAVDRPWSTSALAGAKLAITAILAIALTLRWGMIGTALGLVAGALAEVAGMAVLTNRHLSEPMRVLWPARQAAAMFVAYAAGFAAARGVVAVLPGVAGLVPALGAGTAAYVVAFVATGGVNDRDRLRAADVAARVRRRSGLARPSAAA
jgi:O-antigen/teichoic acid export membrane protein